MAGATGTRAWQLLRAGDDTEVGAVQDGRFLIKSAPDPTCGRLESGGAGLVRVARAQHGELPRAARTRPEFLALDAHPRNFRQERAESVHAPRTRRRVSGQFKASLHGKADLPSGAAL